MNLTAIAALIAAVLSGLGVYQVQEWRYGAKEKDRAEQQLIDVRYDGIRNLRRSDNVIAAQNTAAVRQAALRRDADGARTALVGLSHAADEALRTAAASHDACLKSAAALDDVLKTVSGERRELSEKADRHVNDIKTLTDAWPK